jgi:hypothetical protein
MKLLVLVYSVKNIGYMYLIKTLCMIIDQELTSDIANITIWLP